MAILRGPGAMKQLPLIAVWSDKQVTRGNDGKDVNGAYLDIQLDQSTLLKKDIEAGKAQTNPHIESHKTMANDREFTSHTVWYSKQQLDAMQSAGKTVKQSDGRMACAFTADVTPKVNESTKAKRMIVLLPKDPEKAKTPKDKARIDAYNAAHPVGPSSNTRFNAGSVAKQEKVTAQARALRDSKTASKQAEAQASVEAEAETPTDEMAEGLG